MCDITESDEDILSLEDDFCPIGSSSHNASPIHNQLVPCLESSLEFPILESHKASPCTELPGAALAELGRMGEVSNGTSGNGLIPQSASVEPLSVDGAPSCEPTQRKHHLLKSNSAVMHEALALPQANQSLSSPVQLNPSKSQPQFLITPVNPPSQPIIDNPIYDIFTPPPCHNPISFASLVIGTASKRRVPVQFFPSPADQRDKPVCIPIENLKKASMPFATTLVGKFLGKPISFPTARYKIRGLWNNHCKVFGHADSICPAIISSKSPVCPLVVPTKSRLPSGATPAVQDEDGFTLVTKKNNKAHVNNHGASTRVTSEVPSVTRGARNCG
ncbi:hypothetical protein L2E82_35891 [Cichorium intybus]|uniref:Uncharacterized protein n=1 Tax=Cichorium intybus TaxID=13427 RepID=A0ACB9BQ60_CICIN|nr:hypothetical protein L2E82_35891 [Cichorium intybus]